MSSQPDSIEQHLEYLPEAVRKPVAEWIAQGRSEEAIHGVMNFFSGKGAKLIEQAEIAARVDELEQLKFKTSLMSDIPNRDRVSTQRIEDRLNELKGASMKTTNDIKLPGGVLARLKAAYHCLKGDGVRNYALKRAVELNQKEGL